MERNDREKALKTNKRERNSPLGISLLFNTINTKPDSNNREIRTAFDWMGFFKKDDLGM